MNRLFALVLTFLPLVSCVSVHVENILNDVETYISERPDSALAVLDSIDRDMLTTRKVTSHHALLYAMALDKNFIDVSDDSLAMTALEYYEHHGDRKYKARALYYLGLSHYYSQEYDKAIIEFTKAEEVAQKHDSLYWGMTKVAQADTYGKIYNEVEEYHCICKAYEIYNSISATYYIDASKYRLATILIDMNRYDESDILLLDIIESSDISSKIKSVSLIAYAYSQVVRFDNRYDLAVNVFEKVLKDYDASFMSYKDYWAFAYALHCLGRSDESKELVNQLIQIDTTGTSDYWQYVIEKESLNYEVALNHLEKSTYKNEKEIELALKQELSLKQRDYYAAQSELTSYKMRNRTLLLLSLISISLMVIGYILILISKYLRKQKEERDKYMEYIAEITRQLDEVKNDNSLKNKYIELYKSKFEVLRSLSDQYLQTENRIDAEKIIYKKVVSLVDEIRNDAEHRAGFEAMLDNDLDGIMTNFRKEMPKLKEIDYSIFSYWIAGFDVTTISRLLDTSLNIVYIRKTRIKQHIKDQAPEHMDQFLEMIT